MQFNSIRSSHNTPVTIWSGRVFPKIGTKQSISQGEAFFIVWEPVVCESDRKTDSDCKTVMHKMNRQVMENSTTGDVGDKWLCCKSQLVGQTYAGLHIAKQQTVGPQQAGQVLSAMRSPLSLSLSRKQQQHDCVRSWRWWWPDANRLTSTAQRSANFKPLNVTQVEAAGTTQKQTPTH